MSRESDSAPTALASAHGLAINGFVRNEPDGSVTLDADGSENDLRELVCRIESAMRGRIDGTVVDKQSTRNRNDGFHIRG